MSAQTWRCFWHKICNGQVPSCLWSHTSGCLISLYLIFHTVLLALRIHGSCVSDEKQSAGSRALSYRFTSSSGTTSLLISHCLTLLILKTHLDALTFSKWLILWSLQAWYLLPFPRWQVCLSLSESIKPTVACTAFWRTPRYENDVLHLLHHLLDPSSVAFPVVSSIFFLIKGCFFDFLCLTWGFKDIWCCITVHIVNILL